MPRFAANLSMMYNEHAFLDRFAAAAKDGFKAVEFLFPYDFPAADIKARLDEHGLTQALFNAPPGDWAAGERGIASLPGREDEFRRALDKALEYTAALGNTKLHVMAGLIAPGQSREQHRAVYLKNLEVAASAAKPAGVTIVIEPINTRDIPGFFLTRTDQALALIDEVGSDNLFVQYDIYHMQIMEGDLARTMEANLPRIAHVQLADNPGRNEPGTGEINYPFLFRHLDAIGYRGWIGCEYKPRTTTLEGLGWYAPWRVA